MNAFRPVLPLLFAGLLCLPAQAAPPERCGNGRVEQNRGEVCDDGNTVNGDGCSSDCRSLESCGDGTVNPVTEQCDDANLANDDGCSNSCTFSC